MPERKIILRICEGDPACERAREFVPRVAAALGVDFELQWFSTGSGYPVPQVFVWDGTLLDRVEDQGALFETLAAKLLAEQQKEEAERKTAEAREARQEQERREREELRARKKRGKWKPRAVVPVEPADEGEVAAAPEQRRDAPPDAAAEAGADEDRRERPARLAPVAIPGGRQGRRRLLRRVPDFVRKVLPMIAMPIVFAVAWAALGGREGPSDEPQVESPAGAVAAPSLDLPTLDGFRFDLGREQGRAVLVMLFDGRKPDRKLLAELGEEAAAVEERTRGATRAVAVGVGAGLADLRSALREPPRGLAIAADPDGRAGAAFAAAAGPGAWWVVDRSGRVIARGGQPSRDVFRVLAGAARAER